MIQKQVTLKSYLTLNYYRSIKKIEYSPAHFEKNPWLFRTIMFLPNQGAIPKLEINKRFHRPCTKREIHSDTLETA